MSFAQTMNLRPADVVIVPKSDFRVVGHYVIYGGVRGYGEHFYYENIRGYGVRTISETQFARENPTYSRIRRFEGSDYGRTFAIARAKSLLGKEYDLWSFNCEDYANYVQYNKAYSQQVSNATFAFGALLFIFGLAALAD